MKLFGYFGFRRVKSTFICILQTTKNEFRFKKTVTLVFNISEFNRVINLNGKINIPLLNTDENIRIFWFHES